VIDRATDRRTGQSIYRARKGKGTEGRRREGRKKGEGRKENARKKRKTGGDRRRAEGGDKEKAGCWKDWEKGSVRMNMCPVSDFRFSVYIVALLI